MFPIIYNNTGITDDKVLHFIFSFIITIILFYTIKKFLQYKFVKNLIAIFTFFLIIGLLKEFRDLITPGHNVEIMDIITNYIGMLFGIFFIILTKKHK